MATRCFWPPDSTFGFSGELRGDAQDIGGPVHRRFDPLLGAAGDLQGETHIVGDGHVRIERIVLEDHGNAPFRRFGLRDIAPVDQQFARSDRFKPGDGAQQGGLAAAGRPDHDHELALIHREADAFQRLESLIILDDAFQFQTGHGYGSYFPSPASERTK